MCVIWVAAKGCTKKAGIQWRSATVRGVTFCLEDKHFQKVLDSRLRENDRVGIYGLEGLTYNREVHPSVTLHALL